MNTVLTELSLLSITINFGISTPGSSSNVSLCMIKNFRGEGVVDGDGGNSERCLKWGGVGWWGWGH